MEKHKTLGDLNISGSTGAKLRGSIHFPDLKVTKAPARGLRGCSPSRRSPRPRSSSGNTTGCSRDNLMWKPLSGSRGQQQTERKADHGKYSAWKKQFALWALPWVSTRTFNEIFAQDYSVF